MDFGFPAKNAKSVFVLKNPFSGFPKKRTLSFVFLSVFLALTLHKTHLFREDNQSNPSIKLCGTNLQTRAKQKQKIVQGHGQFNINCDNIVLAFEGFKVS